MASPASGPREVKKKPHKWFVFLELAVFRQYSATVRMDLGMTFSCNSRCFYSKGNQKFQVSKSFEYTCVMWWTLILMDCRVTDEK